MIKQFILSIFPLIITCVFYSCGTYNCGEAEGLRISTIGLTAAEIDTIVLRKFTKGSGLTKLVDTLVIDASNALFQFPFSTNDTSYMGVLNPDVLLKSRYDYEIYIPAAGKRVKITDINEPQGKDKRGFLQLIKLIASIPYSLFSRMEKQYP